MSSSNLLKPPLRSLLITSVMVDDGAHIEKSSRSAADVSWLELEDGVHESKKELARARVAAALRDVEWNGKTRIVRVNSVHGPHGSADILTAARGGASAVLLPKVQEPSEVKLAEAVIAQVPGATTKIWCMIETARALVNVEAIAFASPLMGGLFFGAADYSVSIGVQSITMGSKAPESEEGGTAREPELLYARSRIVAAAAAAGIYSFDVGGNGRRAFDIVYDKARRSFQLGFNGVAIITPRLVETVHRAYAPTKADVEWAVNTLQLDDSVNADAKTVGVMNDAMVDGPFFLHARQIMERYHQSNDTTSD